MSARYAFAAHPEALADLSDVPEKIRDLALLELQHLVHGNERGAALKRELAGCHKVYVDPQTRWRMVIQYRDAPAASQHKREIYLLAVGERQDHAAYRSGVAPATRTPAHGNHPAHPPSPSRQVPHHPGRHRSQPLGHKGSHDHNAPAAPPAPALTDATTHLREAWPGTHSALGVSRSHAFYCSTT